METVVTQTPRFRKMLECISKLLFVAVDFQTVFKSVRIIKSVLNRYFNIQPSNLAEKSNLAVGKTRKRRLDIKQYSSSPKL